MILLIIFHLFLFDHLEITFVYRKKTWYDIVSRNQFLKFIYCLNRYIRGRIHIVWGQKFTQFGFFFNKKEYEVISKSVC